MAIHPSFSLFAGVTGNLISFLVYLAPIPTFYRIYKKKSTEGFQSFPYVVALFSAMLWIYYALVKTGATFLITINSLGCLIETFYLTIYTTYAPRKAKIQTLKMVALVDFGGLGLIVLVTNIFAKGENQVRLLGWICLIFALSVFAAPLSIMKKVIRTKSVEFMPFWLSFFLALSAIGWLLYGLSLKDMYIAVPNVLGFLFGVLQMILYAIYKNKGKTIEDQKLPTSIKQPSTPIEMPTVSILPEALPEPGNGQAAGGANIPEQTVAEEKGMDAAATFQV